jgi:RIO-like serine/threonine protein kinase
VRDEPAERTRRDLRALAQPIIARIEELRSRGGREGAGTRRSAMRLTIENAPEMVVRFSRRGGMASLFLNDLYFGLSPRPVRELAVAAEAAKRGIPIAEPLGAMVQWVVPGVYRGAFITRAIPGITLWEFLRTDDDPHVREHVLGLAREAINTMHERGLVHADLNLHNLLVVTGAERFAVAILDLDKASLLGHPVPAPIRRRNLDRLLRSAMKLDPEGRFIDAASRELLTAP